MITKKELIEAIKHVEDHDQLIITIYDDSNPYPFLRANGLQISEVIKSGQGVDVILSGEFNNDLHNPDDSRSDSIMSNIISESDSERRSSPTLADAFEAGEVYGRYHYEVHPNFDEWLEKNER